MGDGTKEHPYTRDDVVKAIKKYEGTSEKLDLSGKVFEEWIDLSNFHLEGANLGSAKFSADTKLDDVDWGNYILGEEKNGAYRLASDTYRRLKQWYTNAGIYDIAGEFFFREMTAQRKRIEWWSHPIQRRKINWWLHPRHRAWSKFVSLICGYGEKPHRVMAWAASWILGLAIIYFLISQIWNWSAFLRSIYYSVGSFTALGYGSWVFPEPESWAKSLGAAEAALGVFMITLFLVTFTRIMTR
ncbi:potassium channel family protein [Chloroflexota bacterium]